MAKILLIEDYLSLQIVYKETLELAGHKVVPASNAEEALAITQNTEFDVILLDLLLKESSGLDFLKAFSPAHHPKTQVVIISNLFTNEILNNALRLGAKHYLMKSEVTPQQLADVVEETLKAAAEESDSDGSRP
jgi:two-component system, repressor protein LuxO